MQGYLYRQDNPLGLMVIVHGLGEGADSYLPQAQWFLEQGWMVLMYDATGSFDSEGRSTRGFPQSLIDLEAALAYIESDETLNEHDLVVLGHSWGGCAAANSLHLSDAIKAVVAVSAPAHSLEMIFEQAQKSLGVFTYTQWPFLMVYERLSFGEYATYDAVEAINHSDAHTLIIHGKNDAVVDYDGSAIIAKREAITHPDVQFITRDDANRDDHNNLWRSEAAMLYFDDINQQYRALYDAHEGNIPYAINQAFYEDLDRFLLQELDEDLMMTMHTFLINALERDH